ncbi:hypothetical protein LCL85_19860 [Vibrio alginolyticus]|nr:hypothetical protein [Vibrio alginolyticus]
MAFEKGNTFSKGRPKGSRNKRSLLSDEITSEALTKLKEAVIAGEAWAVQEVLKRTHPMLKSVTPESSLDTELLSERIKELVAFEERIAALENLQSMK